MCVSACVCVPVGGIPFPGIPAGKMLLSRVIFVFLSGARVVCFFFCFLHL